MKKTFQIILVTTLLFAAFSCKKDKDEKKDKGPKPVSFEVQASDDIKYDKTSLEAMKEAEITLTLKNIGELPKEAMGHNLVILKPGTDVEQFALAALYEEENDYIPEALSSQIIAHTKLLGPGESDKIVFEIADVGEYEYLCTFPGHHVTMKGKLEIIK